MALNNHTDLSTFIGILLAFAMIIAAIFFGQSPESFIDIPSVLIVLGGTFAVTIASYSFTETMRTLGIVAKTIVNPVEDPKSAGENILHLADVARRNGLLAIQEAGRTSGTILQKGISMIVDGLEPDHVERTLRQDIQHRLERHSKGAAVLRRAGEISPAMGLIGTLIGLVQMLQNLDDPDSIGPAMAVALLTTLYGAVLAYVVFIPLANKLERNSQEELLTDQVYIKGVGAIGRKENPRRIEITLNTILPPTKRLRVFEGE